MKSFITIIFLGLFLATAFSQSEPGSATAPVVELLPTWALPAVPVADLNLPDTKFRLTAPDYVSFGLFALSGVASGFNKAYHADNYVFEKRGWTGKYWRHNAWENNYPGDNYHDGESPVKPEFLNGFNDVWHGSNDVKIFAYGTACFAIGLSDGIRIGKGKAKWWHPVVKGAIGQAVRIGVENITHQWLRN